MNYLFHGTSSQYLAKILKTGLPSKSYWGTKRMATYYAENEVSEKGGIPILIRIPLNMFKTNSLKPDKCSIEEPLTHTLGQTEGALWNNWDKSKQTWKDCLEIFESLCYMHPITITKEDIIVLRECCQCPSRSLPHQDSVTRSATGRVFRFTDQEQQIEEQSP